MEGKKELIEKVKAQLRELEPHLEKFQGKARIAKAETAVKYEKIMLELREKKSGLEERLKELRDAGEGSWTALKGGIEKASQDIKKAFDEAKKHFQ